MYTNILYVYEYKGVYQCMWYQDTLGQWYIIDFQIVSSDHFSWTLK